MRYDMNEKTRADVKGCPGYYAYECVSQIEEVIDNLDLIASCKGFEWLKSYARQLYDIKEKMNDGLAEVDE